MNKLVLTHEEMLLAERIAIYYRQPEKTSYFDKEIYFEAIHKNPNIHYMALKINKNIYNYSPKK